MREEKCLTISLSLAKLKGILIFYIMKLYSSFAMGKDKKRILINGSNPSLEDTISKSIIALKEMMEKQNRKQAILEITEFEEVAAEEGIDYTDSKITVELLVNLSNKGKKVLD